jgi:putative hemolysin
MMSNKTVLFGVILGMLFTDGLTPQVVAAEKVGMANPASVNCIKSGYKREIKTKPDGSQYRVCIFSEGKECEEWAFFRGECGVEYRKPQVPQTEEFCRSDEDCACGTHVKTGKCFYGNKLYVDTTKQCPDFCSGFAGNLMIQCVNDECRQVPAKAKN